MFATLFRMASCIFILFLRPLFYPMIFYCSCSSYINLGSMFSYSNTFLLSYAFFLTCSTILSSLSFSIDFILFSYFLVFACSWLVTSSCSLYIFRVLTSDSLSILKASANELLWLLIMLSDTSVWRIVLCSLKGFVLILLELSGLVDISVWLCL